MKKEKLMETIDVEKYYESEFDRWQEEFGKYKEKQGEKKGIKIGEKKGIKIGEKRIIKTLLKSMNSKEISEKTGFSLSEINKIAEQ